METNLLREIHIKDLRIGDILVNMGCVVQVEEFANVYRVKTVDHLTTYPKSRSVTVKRNLHE